jgi:hypothetical protein
VTGELPPFDGEGEPLLVPVDEGEPLLVPIEPTPAPAPAAPQAAPPPPRVEPATGAADPLVQAAPFLPIALAALLGLQWALPMAAPPVFAQIAAGLVRGSQPFVATLPLLLGALPWAAYLALHLSQARLLRARGRFAWSDEAVTARALVPGYNVLGSASLFAAEGEALAALGAAPAAAGELRAAGLAASAAAATTFGLQLVAVALFPSGQAGLGADVLGAFIQLLAVVTLVVRLFVLLRLRAATRQVLGMAPVPAPGAPRGPALAAVRGPALGLVLCVVGLFAARWVYENHGLRPPLKPPPAALPPPIPALAPRPAPALVAAAAAAPGPADPFARKGAPPPRAGFTDQTLLGGRPVAWWQSRLELLRGRTDPEGRELYQLTADRAVANGLEVKEVDGALRVYPSEALRAALAEEPAP